MSIKKMVIHHQKCHKKVYPLYQKFHLEGIPIFRPRKTSLMSQKYLPYQRCLKDNCVENNIACDNPTVEKFLNYFTALFS